MPNAGQTKSLHGKDFFLPPPPRQLEVTRVYIKIKLYLNSIKSCKGYYCSLMSPQIMPFTYVGPGCGLDHPIKKKE